MKWTGILALIAIMGLGCGDGANPAVMSEFLGVYMIDDYQGRVDSCDDPLSTLTNPIGDNVNFIVVHSFFLAEGSGPFIGVQFCQDEEFCRTLGLEETQPVGPGTWVFREGSDADGWTGFAPIGDIMEVGAECELRAQVHSLNRTTGGALTVLTETKTSARFGEQDPPGSGMVECTVEQGLRTLATQSCEEIIRLRATFVADL